MKTPDKIYMPNELLSEEWQRHINGEDTCYIRKDALLEWLEERRGKSITVGEHYAFGQIIEKINSL